jgi:hypothetical protein
MYEAATPEITADDVVVVPAGAKELLAELAAIREAEIAVDVRKVETVHALCLVYGTVDEDAFGEAAEQLIYRGEQGTPPVAEYLSLEVSALLGISPGSGAALIGQVLNCVYRHPVLWDAVRQGKVRWYRALAAGYDDVKDLVPDGVWILRVYGRGPASGELREAVPDVSGLTMD